MAWYLGFCKQHKIDNPCGLDDCYASFRAIYAKALITGQNMVHRTIKAATARLYLEAVNDLYRWLKLDAPIDFRDSTDLAVFIVANLEEWEAMPKRREPISPEMTEFLRETSQGIDPDSFEAAIWDWFVLSRYIGQRISEFGQTTQDRVDYHETPAGAKHVKAFILDDFKFLTKRRQVIDDLDKLFDENHAKEVKTTFRFQKNRRNGETISLRADDVDPDLCPVRAAARIMSRARRLGQGSDEPAGVYLNNKKKKKHITGAKISKWLRNAATVVHNITDPEELARFSPHSFRVTAAVLLHQAGKGSAYIKLRIRWASDAFMLYLRSTPEIMDQHTRAVGTENARMRKLRLNPANVPETVEPTVEIDPYGINIVTDIDD